MSDVAPFDPERIIRTLSQHGVDYVLVGALAARLQGFPRLTADLDLTPSDEPDNLEALASALRSLNARVFTDGVPEGLAFDCSARTLASAALWNLVTDAGRVDVIYRPAGTSGFADLLDDAVRFEVYDTEILAASLADIVRSKEATGRPQDRQDVVILRRMIGRDAG